jgi:hypothetical protein
MSNTIKFIRGAEADIPVLNQGEPAFTTDTHKVFIGDGAENHQLAGIDDAGEVNTASNIGNEVEIFKQKSTYDLEFRTLKANSDKIIISSEGEGDPIDIGTQGVDPGYHPLSLAQTFIAGGNPVLKSGNIDTLVVSSWADLTGVKLIAFEKVGTNDFTAKRYQSIGTITAGTEVEVEVDLDVLEGEYLGIWGTGGSFKTQETGGVGLWSHVGDQSEGEDVTFSLTSGYEIYLYGTGTGDPATLDYVKFDVNAEAVLADLTLTEADISDLGAYLEKTLDSTLADDHSYSGLLDSQPVGESVVFGDLLYFDWTATEWKKAKADAAATTPAMRIALESKGDGEECLMLVLGYIRDDSAFEFTSAIAYLSDGTAGAILYAAPSDSGDQVQRVGIGISADIMYFNPSIDVGEI